MPFTIKDFSTAFGQGQQTGSSAANDALAGLLKGKQAKAQVQNDIDTKRGINQADIEGLRNLKNSGLAQEGGNSGVGGAHTGVDPYARTDPQREKNTEKQQEGYSKRLEKINGFSSALEDIEQRSNSDGKGGVLTNPSAKLMSTGKAMSAMPTQLLGLGEMTGIVPKGTADERKSLERLQLEYQKAMTGMRTSEEMSKRERAAMGFLASGDPELVSKGIRALAHNVARATKTIQGGYVPEVRARVHEVTGDPMDTLGRVYQDPAFGQPSQAPQGAPAAAPSAGFDPDAYLKGK